MEPIRFSLTEPMVVKAVQLHGQKYLPLYFKFAVLVGLAVSAYFLTTRGDFSPERVLIQVSATMIGAVCLSGIMAGITHFLTNPFFARRNYRQQKPLAEEIALSWTDDRYVYASGRSQTDMAFADLYGYQASKELVLLGLSEMLFHVIPSSALGDEALARELIAKLEAAGVKRR